MHPITIRRLEIDDAEFAANAITALKPSGERRGLPACETDARSFLRESGNILLVASCGGAPVGFAIAYLLERADRTEPMLLLYEIEVAAIHRRCGIGQLIVEHVKQIGRDGGAFKMWVLTDPANLAARGLYRACNGTESGENLLIEWAASGLEAPVVDALPSADDAPGSPISS